jgi:hypothetical protein
LHTQGWFDWSRSNDGVENNTVRMDQTIDQEKTNEDAARSTNETAKTADTVTE